MFFASGHIITKKTSEQFICINQGNDLTNNKIKKIKRGDNKKQIKKILGETIFTNIFKPKNTIIYINYKQNSQQMLIITFKNKKTIKKKTYFFHKKN